MKRQFPVIFRHRKYYDHEKNDKLYEATQEQS